MNHDQVSSPGEELDNPLHHAGSLDPGDRAGQEAFGEFGNQAWGIEIAFVVGDDDAGFFREIFKSLNAQPEETPHEEREEGAGRAAGPLAEFWHLDRAIKGIIGLEDLAIRGSTRQGDRFGDRGCPREIRLGNRQAEFGLEVCCHFQSVK